jgi:hypothetical protein
VTPRPRGGPKRLARWLAVALVALACSDSRSPSQGDEYCRSHPDSSDCMYDHCEEGDLEACEQLCALGTSYGCQRLEWECQERQSEHCPEADD